MNKHSEAIRNLFHVKKIPYTEIDISVDEDAKKQVMTQFPYIDNLECWADRSQEKFVNGHEKAIFNLRKWPRGIKEYTTEGYIKFERVRSHDCFFNSNFESGNLRQVFKVPQEPDFDWVPVEERVPDYLPEELQEERR